MSKPIVSSFSLTLFLILSYAFAQSIPQNTLPTSYEGFEEKALQPKNKIWIVDFWASWCPPCVASAPELRALNRAIEGKPIELISISWDQREENWRMAIERLSLKWNHILIPDVRNTPFIDKHFPHKGIPAMFMIRRDGKIKRARDMRHLERLVDKALKKGL